MDYCLLIRMEFILTGVVGQSPLSVWVVPIRRVAQMVLATS